RRGGGAHVPRRRAQAGERRGGAKDPVARFDQGAAGDGEQRRERVMSRAYAKIATARAGGVETITLNVPERRNAIGPQMTNELLWALSDARAAEDVRVVVITGAGKVFCAGGD